MKGWMENLFQLEENPSNNNFTALILTTSLYEKIQQKQNSSDGSTVKSTHIEDDIVAVKGANSVHGDVGSNKRGVKQMSL